jgi:hypothetical protein
MAEEQQRAPKPFWKFLTRGKPMTEKAALVSGASIPALPNMTLNFLSVKLLKFINWAKFPLCWAVNIP